MRGNSRRLLAAALFAVALVIVVNLAWWIFYDRTADMLDRQLSRRLTAIAAVTAASISPDQAVDLALGDLDAYSRTVDLLLKARDADSLSELFIVDRDYRYLATTSLERATDAADSLYFLARLNGPYIDSLMFGTRAEPVATPSYRTGKVYLKSAFAPLRGFGGSTAAVLGVEASVDYFDSLADLRRNLYYATAASLAGGLVFGLLFLLFQRRLNRAEQRLLVSETHAYLGRMVALVSHEIKNPLMIVRASAERMRKKHGAEEAVFVMEEVDRLNEIVSGYLDFAKGPELSLLKLEKPSGIHLAELFDNVAKHMRDKYADHEFHWLPSETPDTLVLFGYPRALRQVLLNLLINGADACLDSGKPILVGLRAEDKGESVEIVAADRGPGIDKKQQRLLFEPFATTKLHGSGLGLYLTKKIVEEMGGRIDIVSETGSGTQVTVTLPKTPK